MASRRRTDGPAGPEKNPPRSGRYGSPTGAPKKSKGSTVPELDFKRIEYTPEEIETARRRAPEDLHDVLGLLPEHEPDRPGGWFYWRKKTDG